MAKSKNPNRTTLVDGCGTILKTNRLKGGYRLVKRKRAVGSSTASMTESAKTTKRKAGSPTGSKNVSRTKMMKTAPVMATAPAKRRGRPASVRLTAPVMATAPAKRRGRPASVKLTAPVMASPRKKIKTKKIANDFIQAKERARKSGAKSFTYEGKTYVQSKATNTGLVVYKRANVSNKMQPSNINRNLKSRGKRASLKA